MPLASIKYRWPSQIDGGNSFEFTVETLALRNAPVIFDPRLRIHNMGIPNAEDVELTIEYVLNMGTLPDPLNSGIFRWDVVSGVVVSSGALWVYDFDGGPLDKQAPTIGVVTHNVTITNTGASPVIVQPVLSGTTEVGGQYNAGSTIFSGTP